MPYQVAVIQSIDAAHQLIGYPGNCANIHGHTWKVELIISGDQLDSIGMLADFRDVRQKLTQVLMRFDHNLINSQPPFDHLNPTSENLARYIFEQMQGQFDCYRVKEVRVWESESTWAGYSEEEDH